MSLSSPSSRPTADDKVASRARNLFVIAAAVIVYMLAGADLNNLTVLGLRAPAKFPIVFSWAAVIALLWFWWRYFVAWINAQSRTKFRTEYLRALHNSPVFHRYLKKRTDFKAASNIAKARYNLSASDDLIPDSVVADGNRRLFVIIENYEFLSQDNPNNRYAVNLNQLPMEDRIKVAIPWWFHFGVGIPYFLWHALRREHFADQVLPNVVFIAAAALIYCKFLGVDPAGVFGMISDNPDNWVPDFRG